MAKVVCTTTYVGRQIKEDDYMTKIRYFALPILMVFFSAARAVRSISTETLTNIPPSSFDNFFVACITLGILSIAFTIKNKYWSAGVIFAGLAYVARSILINFPDKKLIFASTTLISCAVSAFLLVIAWRTINTTTLSQRGNQPSSKASFGFFIVVLIIILGIFLYWGRG